MYEGVSRLLEQRRHEIGARALGRAVFFALALHVAAVAVAVWSPSWTRAPALPPSFVAVQIVPASQLGVVKPKPAPRPKTEAPKPVPKPQVEAPVLPKPEAKKPPEPAPVRPEPEASNPPEAAGSQTGSDTGLSLGAAVAAFDSPNFTYGYYVDQMLAKISSNWARPPIGSGVEATLYYRIERDGRISNLRIVRSSGINSFDLAALRAVQASSPLPPLPRAFREDSLGVNLIVR